MYNAAQAFRYTHTNTGGKLPALQDTYSTRCHKKIIKDNNHRNHCLFTLLPSRRQGQYRCIKAGAERLKNSFHLKAIRLRNNSHLLREAAAYIETQIIVHFNKWITSHFKQCHFNNVCISYITHLICTVYTVSYTVLLHTILSCLWRSAIIHP